MTELALMQRRPSADLVRSRAATGARGLARAVSHARASTHAGAGAGLRLVQTKLLVGAAHDPFEHEAERTADAVSAGQFPSLASPLGLLRVTQRALGKGEDDKRDEERERRKDKGVKHVQRFIGSPGTAPSEVGSGIESGILTRLGGGAPLDPATRHALEPRFGYDFLGVRVHTDASAAGAARALGARAFTLGQDVFFGGGEYQPGTATGRHLIAHELTHTIQQAPSTARPSHLLRAPRMVQRWEGPIDRARARVAEYLARDFPPWELITLLIGRDPVRNRPVAGATRDWIRAAMRLAPDGPAMFEKLHQEGKIDAIARWWDTEVAKVDLSLDGILALVRRAWDALDPSDALDPLAAWNSKIKPIFAPTMQRVWTFIQNVATKVFQVIRDVVLQRVGTWAKEQRGYRLLTMVLGRDPVTSEPVTATLEGVIFAVLALVSGGEKIKENLEKAKTVEKAAAWFKTEVKKLDITWQGIVSLFTKAWEAFKIKDLLNLGQLVGKMWGIFGPTVTRLLAFLTAVAKKLLELVFEGAMILAGPIGVRILGIIRRAGTAFNKIVSDPVVFVRHLVDAVKRGFHQFGARIWEHLKDGLIGWLVGALEGAGLRLPTAWDLKGILDLVLQVLGITYAKIRERLVKVIGERAMSMLERAFAFIKTLVTEGPAAAWREIVAAIGSLWDMVIGGIKDWAITKIVTAAITKLATMFNPAGAIIQAVIATYNTIAFFVERIQQIVALVEAVVDSIANIADGKIAAAANYVERTMARTIPVILSFLARLIGLGDVSGAIKKVITALHEKVDKGIDAAIAWIVAKAKQLFGIKDKDGPEGAGEVPTTAFVDEEENEQHHISGRMDNGKLVATISSQTQHLDEFIAEAEKAGRFDSKIKAAQLDAVKKAVSTLESTLHALEIAQDEPQKAAARPAVQAAELAVAEAVKSLLAGVSLKEFDERYALEGMVATYGSMPKQTYDKLTPDHQPQAALVKYVAALEYDDPDTGVREQLFKGKQVQTVSTGHATGAVAINLHHSRHLLGLTYGKSVNAGVTQAISAVAKMKVPVKGKEAALAAQRSAVMHIVKDRLKHEVSDISTKIKASAFEDVTDWVKKKKRADEYTAKLRTRIEKGEDAVLKQNLEGWST
jgi:hypothetical protein